LSGVVIVVASYAGTETCFGVELSEICDVAGETRTNCSACVAGILTSNTNLNGIVEKTKLTKTGFTCWVEVSIC